MIVALMLAGVAAGACISHALVWRWRSKVIVRDGYITFRGPITEEQAQRIATRWRAQHRGEQ
jgi:hypothetical protein